MKKIFWIGLACIALLCALLLASCDSCDHEWEVTMDSAGCLTGGTATLVCSKCGKVSSRPSQPLGHDWDNENIQVIVAPTCTEHGQGWHQCKRCSTWEQFVMDLAEHNLKLDFDKSSSPTCTKDGLRAGTCKTCKQYIEQVLPALGHDFTGKSVITRESTCEGTGLAEVTCKRKDCDGNENGTPAVLRQTIPALGHDWQQESTIDVEPTFTSSGERSVHCNRCDQTTERETVPMLVAGKAVEYSLRLIRPNKEILSLGLDNVTITVKDGDRVVATSNRENFIKGIMTVELEPKQYTATVTGLPEGYSAETEYTINPGSIEKDLVVHASLLPASGVTSETRYRVGSVMHDYTLKDVRTGQSVTMHELLATKKFVLFNFFFSDCGACQSETPGLMSAYDIYKDDIALVMLDVVDYDTSEKIINEFLTPYKVPASVYVVQDMTPEGQSDDDYNNICEKFGFSTAPQSIIVDSEGVVVYLKAGAEGEMEFRALFKKYTSAPYYIKED